VALGGRNQALKLTPEFNAVVQTYSQLFADMESSMLDSSALKAQG
jgi:hypothetical protein